MYYRVHKGTHSSLVTRQYIVFIDTTILIHMDHHDILLKNLLDHEPLHSILS